MSLLSFHRRALLAMGLSLGFGAAQAATPASGTISEASPTLSYTVPAMLVPNASGAQGQYVCDATNPCDIFELTLDLPANYPSANPRMRLRIDAAATASAGDVDLYLTGPDGKFIAESRSNPPTQESILFVPIGGSNSYQVRVFPGTPIPGGTVNISLIAVDGGGGTPGSGPSPFIGIAPRYQVFTPPSTVGARSNSGEINIGFNPKTGRFMTLAFLSGTTLRVTPPELLVPQLPESCDALWEDKTPLAISQPQAVGDPILFTDGVTGRTWASNFTAGANYSYAYTDDDGDKWTEAGVAPPNGGADHQTIGSGPYPAGSPFQKIAEANGFPNAVYYCSQASLPDFCQRSDDGGRTYGPGNAINTGQACGGIHGHVRVDHKGSVYVPDKSCGGGTPGYSVSDDAGLRWRDVLVSPATSGNEDPSIGIDADNALYYCNVNADGHPHVLVSPDQGVTWASDADIGAAFGIQNAVFTNAIAGDAGRAACAFIGTDVPGNHDGLDFVGIWHAYIAHTYDGGRSWVTVSISPDDPVQGVGGICRGGTVACMNKPDNRNLLDFNEITLDNSGRPAYAFDDGCVGDCVTNPITISLTAEMKIARQYGGRSLIASLDKPEPVAPNQACLAGKRNSVQSSLSWKTPDDGGTAISGYKIFRATSLAGSYSQIATVAAGNSYNDTTVDTSVPNYYYKITSLNAAGEGKASNLVDLPVTQEVLETSCTTPGLTQFTDPAGDATAPIPGHDLLLTAIAEPADMDGKMVITMKVDSLSRPPPDTRWVTYFTTPDGVEHYTAMLTDQGPARFEYGTSKPDPAAATVRVFTSEGVPDAGSGFSADGLITIVLDKAKVGALKTGDALSNVTTSIRTTSPGTGAGSSLDTAISVTYKLLGTAICTAGPVVPPPVTPPGGLPSGIAGQGRFGGGAFGLALLPLIFFGLRRRRR